MEVTKILAFILRTIGAILLIWYCLYLARNSKIYDKVLVILRELKEISKLKPKKPKNLNSFWKTYTNREKKVDNAITSLESELKDIKKHNYWIPIFAAIFSAVMLLLSVGVQYYDAIGGFQQKPEVVGYEIINKHANTTQEMYRIWLHNTGNISAKDVTIKVEFPFQNSTIVQLFKHAKEIIINGSESGGVDDYEYNLKYSEILVGEHVNLTIDVDIDDLGIGKDDILWPKAQVWIGTSPPIDLIRRDDVKFLW